MALGLQRDHLSELRKVRVHHVSWRWGEHGPNIDVLQGSAKKPNMATIQHPASDPDLSTFLITCARKNEATFLT